MYSSVPREELHQFLIGLMGDYMIPGAVYEYEKVLRHPSLVTSQPGAAIPSYVISNDMLAGVWARLRDRLASVDSSSSMIQITQDYAAHFYAMYIDKHEGKHLTGDRIRILTWLSVQTTRMYSLQFCAGTLELLTCSTCITWKSIWLMQRVMMNQGLQQ